MNVIIYKPGDKVIVEYEARIDPAQAGDVRHAVAENLGVPLDDVILLHGITVKVFHRQRTMS